MAKQPRSFDIPDPSSQKEFIEGAKTDYMPEDQELKNEPLTGKLVRAPKTLWKRLDEHLKEINQFQHPNRTAWIINAIVNQMKREGSTKI